jgi:2-methylcitrate dehydratase PrpD
MANTEPLFTEEIARFITDTQFEDLPTPVVSASKLALLDYIGVTLAAGDEASVKIINDYVSTNVGNPEAGVIGEGFKTSADQAAWVNGTKGHALDYDDYFVPPGLTSYHQTVAILPAVLAVGEKCHATGKDILLAYVVGFEVEAKIASKCNKQQYNLGWHTTSTLGSLGAAAAAAKLLKLDKEETTVALGIAASLAGGLRKNFGTMTKPLHAGNAARNGVVASLLAQKGFNASTAILDSPIGFCEVTSGEVSLEAKETEASNSFYLISPGISYKPYPSCAYGHWAIDAALSLRNEGFISAVQDIVEIECRTPMGMESILRYSRPQTPLEAKFSLEFVVASAIINGEVTLKQFTEKRVADHTLQALISRIRFTHPTEFGSGLTSLGGELVVKMRGGAVHSCRVDIAKGTPRNPLTLDEMKRKYMDCVSSSLSPECTEQSLDMILNHESIADIAQLMHLIT